jgi:hypothetical protein
MDACIDALTGGGEQLTQAKAEGISELDVGDQSIIEERARTTMRLVNHLIAKYQVARLEFIAKAARGTTRDDRRNAQLLESPDVGTIGDTRWVQAMARPMS